MRINAGTGDSIEEIILAKGEGAFTVELDGAVEILSCGLKQGQVVLYGLVKNKKTWRQGKRTFIIHAVGKDLPMEHFKYFFYVGIVVKMGWVVFELI